MSAAEISLSLRLERWKQRALAAERERAHLRALLAEDQARSATLQRENLRLRKVLQEMP